MSETYKKVGEHLEVTKTTVDSVTESDVLQEKAGLQEDKKARLGDILCWQKDVAQIDAQLAIIEDKLRVIHEESDQKE